MVVFWVLVALVSLGICGGIYWGFRLVLPAEYLGFRGPDLVFAGAAFLSSIAAMLASRLWNHEYGTENHPTRRAEMGAPVQEAPTPPPAGVQRYLTARKLQNVRGLTTRDVGPLTFDVATHSDLAEIAEYRGIIHWHRDVVEKLLSVFLVLVFSLFLGRAALYLIDFIRGDNTVVTAVQTDIHLAALLIGLALIIDGLLLVAAMTDAPGIGRTLDSLIVVLAGIIIIYFDPSDLRSAGTLGLYLVLAVAILFLVRWIIRHHTISEWKGRDA